MGRSRQLAGRLSLLLLATVLSLLAIELVVRVFDLLRVARLALDQSATQGLRPDADLEKPAYDEGESSQLIPHPYRGWTKRPHQQGTQRFQRSGVNVFGLEWGALDPRTLDPADLNVGIFGGSVAVSVAAPENAKVIEEEIRARYHGPRRVVVTSFAQSGAAQPQHLEALTEALLMKVPLAVVVTLDGVNEVTQISTALHGHHPLYQFFSYAPMVAGGTGRLTAKEIELSAEVVRHRGDAARLRQTASHPMLRWSQLARGVLGVWALRADRAAVTAETTLRTEMGNRRSSAEDVFDLPTSCKPDACWDLIAGMWSESSLLMNALAGSAGARYFHFLQPNQYVPDTKPLSRDELATAWLPSSETARAVQEGYPVLRNAARGLAAKVAFHDLSSVFRGHRETLFIDSCCHVNTDGRRIVAREIGRTIGEALTH